MEQDSTVDWDHMEESELDGLWDKFGEMVVKNPDVMALEDLDDTDSKQCKYLLRRAVVSFSMCLWLEYFLSCFRCHHMNFR